MLSVENLKFKYENQPVWLFDGLNLKLEAGRIYGLLGKNGAGKTSFLKIACGLLFPEEGTCRFLEYPVKKRLPDMLEHLFFLPEEFFMPTITAKKYIELYAPFYKSFDRAFFAHALQCFEISENQILSALSYGQKKKSLIAFGLATSARLCILDEPTNGLDIPSKEQFRKLLAESLNENRSIIISTHQVRDVENLLDTILILDQGKMLLQESLSSLQETLACSDLEKIFNWAITQPLPLSSRGEN